MGVNKQLVAVFVSKASVCSSMNDTYTESVTEVAASTDLDGDDTDAIYIRGEHPNLHGVVAVRPIQEFTWGDGSTYYLWELVTDE